MEMIKKLVDEIKDEELKLLTLNEELLKLREQLNETELMHEISVQEAIDESGKKMYSNDTKRKIALSHLLNTDTHYQENHLKFVTHEREAKVLAIGLNYKKRLFKYYLIIKEGENDSINLDE